MNPTIQVLDSPELLRNILIQADYDTILNYCRSYFQAQEICKDNVFWMQKAQHDFEVPFDVFRNTKLSPIQRYLEIFTENGNVAVGSEEFINLEEFIARAIREDRLDLIQYIINSGFDDWLYPLEEYAAKGNKQEVDKYLALANNEYAYQIAAIGAVRGNHKQLFDYILSLAPPTYNWKFHELAEEAAKAGNQEFFDYILSLVPRDYGWDLSTLTWSAAQSENIQLFSHVLSLIPSNFPLNYNGLAWIALYNKKKEMFDYIRFIAPPNYPWDYNNLIIATIESVDVRSVNITVANTRFESWLSIDQKLLDYVWKLAPPNYSWNYNKLAGKTIEFGFKELFDYIRSLAPLGYNWDFKSLVKSAIESTKNKGGRGFDRALLLFRYVYSLVSSLTLNYPWNYQELAHDAISYGNKELFDYIYSLVPSYPWNFQALAKATWNKELFSHIYSLAPSDYPWNYQDLANSSLHFTGKELFAYIYSLVSSLTPNYPWNYNTLVFKAAESQDPELYNYVRSLVRFQ